MLRVSHLRVSGDWFLWFNLWRIGYGFIGDYLECGGVFRIVGGVSGVSGGDGAEEVSDGRGDNIQ